MPEHKRVNPDMVPAPRPRSTGGDVNRPDASRSDYQQLILDYENEIVAQKATIEQLERRIATLEGSTFWRMTERPRRLAIMLKRTRGFVRTRIHTMNLGSIGGSEQDLSGTIDVADEGLLLDLSSDHSRLPHGWCWFSMDLDEADVAPHLLIYSASGQVPDQVIPIVPNTKHVRMLLRLPDHVSRVRFAFPDRERQAGIARVVLQEVGQVQLLVELVRERPLWALKALLQSKSLLHWKMELVKRWYNRQPGAKGLDWMQVYESGARCSAIVASGSTYRFTVIMPIHKVRAEWLRRAIKSVVNQTYINWELVCVDDGSNMPELTAILEEMRQAYDRIKVIARPEARGVSSATNEGIAAATGDYIVFMDHDDILEPHALARFADAVAEDGAQILYGDEIVIDSEDASFIALQARPAFSYDYYMSHPFVVHPIAVDATLVRRIGGLNEKLDISQDVDFVLRLLETNPVITHIPDVLYRWRLSTKSAGHRLQSKVMDVTCELKEAHLRRVGFPHSRVKPGRSFNTFTATYHQAARPRILAVIPTKNGYAILKQCVDTVKATCEGADLDFCIIDHQSDDAATIAYLDALERGGTTIHKYQGIFNYSAINNSAVRAHGAGYDYFLFLNNDIEAQTPGWLDAMLDLGMRDDVGIVGATLLYPDRLVQHAGVIVGMHGAAEHSYKFLKFGSTPGTGSGLDSTRDYSAVTAACMLVRADAFRAVDGFDEDLRVGFNDTDFCLRVLAKGYRILNSADAVLIHHESASRGKSTAGQDPHPQDSALFRDRYREFLKRGDPSFSPLLDSNDPQFSPSPSVRRSLKVNIRTRRDVLPRPGASRENVVAHEADEAR